MQFISDALKSATEMVKQVRVSSVLNPILWVLPVPTIGLVLVSFTGNIMVQYFLMLIIGVPTAVLLLTFLGILAFGDKSLLRSEDYVISMKTLELIGDQKHTYKEIKNSPEQNNPTLSDPKNAEIPEPKKIEQIEQEKQ